MKFKEYPYAFSVIMAVYQVESYLKDAIESLIKQSIGFNKIQLILVDDGSTDNSGNICDEYQKRYPKNIFVIHKENGGVASARNTGLKLATGRFLNFMDSDDKFTRNTFRNVYRFFVAHEFETDICTVPIYYFDAKTGKHWQNKKFDSGSRVIDLTSEQNTSLMFVNASFFAFSCKERINFDSHLVCGEDMKVILSILLEKMTLGVVSEGRYLYRRRKGETNASLIQSSKKKKGWYDDYFTYLIDWGIDKCKEKFGIIPGFIQHEFLEDLHWRFCQNYETQMFLALGKNISAVQQYKQRLIHTVAKFDDSNIIQVKELSCPHKDLILRSKYAKPAILCQDEHDANLIIDDTVLCSVSNIETTLEFFSLDNDQKTFTIEGYHVLFDVLEKEPVEPYYIINDQPVPCEVITRSDTIQWLGDTIATKIGFKVVLPLNAELITCQPALMLRKTLIPKRNIEYGAFFPISQVYKYSYAKVFNRFIVISDGRLIISNQHASFKTLPRECLLLSEIWQKNATGGKKAVLGRLFYHCVKPFKKKQLWIISDRITNADDNGEALFCYLKENPPQNTRVIFSISSKSKDYSRLKRIGTCVNAMSIHHKLLYLLCDVNISSQADLQTINPFYGYHDALRDFLYHQHFVFLQHGITEKDISGYVNRYSKNISGFVTSSNLEAKSIVNGSYALLPNNVWLTGMPRFDRLYHKEDKIVTIKPTWRSYLMDHQNHETGQWIPIQDFLNSDYYHFYDSLLNSKRLLAELSYFGYRLAFSPHPIIHLSGIHFHKDDRVIIFPFYARHRDIFAKSELMVTDYSSVAFDFAYLYKPVVYCQFDKNEFFSGNHMCKRGYFDYERDGFGEVTYDLESTIDLILNYVSTGCKLKDLYRQRIDSFFAFRDQDNCQRVVERILSLQPKQ